MATLAGASLRRCHASLIAGSWLLGEISPRRQAARQEGGSAEPLVLDCHATGFSDELRRIGATLVAARYINVAEHPARMALETRMAALQRAPSYKRATLLQAPLALLSLVSGAAVWLPEGDVAWFAAALLIGAVVPFTFLVIMPTNHRLLTPDRDLASAQTKALLVKWSKLHAVRTLLSLVASVCYLRLLRAANRSCSGQAA